jgi:hypothetical protein
MRVRKFDGKMDEGANSQHKIMLFWGEFAKSLLQPGYPEHFDMSVISFPTIQGPL